MRGSTASGLTCNRCARKGLRCGSGQKADGRKNEIWRRITGIFPHVEISSKERRAGLARLAKYVERKTQNAKRKINCNAGILPAQNRRSRSEAQGTCAEIFEIANEQGAFGTGSQLQTAAARGTLNDAQGASGIFDNADEQGASELTGGTPVPRTLSFVSDWDFAPETWARVQNGGTPVEALCAELGLSRAMLTLLLKEHCGLSADEFIDGLKFKGLKEALILRLREAAEALWGYPGSYIERKLENPKGESGLAQRRKGADVGRFSKSPGGRMEGRVKNPPRDGAPDLFNESRAEERARRIEELCAVLGAMRGSGKRTQRRGIHVFDPDAFALRAGFESFARLKRACVNVLGCSLESLERVLAHEVVRYYICAEDRALREFACRDDEHANTFRAREIYHQSEERPQPPFFDEWSKHDELARGWLRAMWMEFG